MAATTVDDYVAGTTKKVRATLEAARALVRRVAPEAQEIMKYGAPTYLASGGKPQVYLYAGKDHVNIGFYHGALLDDPEGLLKGKGKSGRHVSFHSPDALDDARIESLVRAAIVLEVEGDR